MSNNLRKCMKTMHFYCCAGNRKVKKTLLEQMAKHECFFEALYEIVNNIHLRNIDLGKLAPAQKLKLKKYVPIMCKIHEHPKSKAIRRKIVIQSGGWLPLILPVVTTAVGELINYAISKARGSGPA